MGSSSDGDGAVVVAGAAPRPVMARKVSWSVASGEPACARLERRRGALRDDDALVDDDEPVGERVGLVEVVGGQEDGRAVLGAQPADQLPQVGAAARVEAGGRLVEEQHLRAGG